MKEKSVSILSQAPKGLLTRPLSADFKALAISAAKIVGRGVTGNWEEAASNAADAIASIGLAQSSEELAFTLVKRSLAMALFEILSDSLDSQLSNLEDDASAAIEKLNLPEMNIELGPDFFEHPSELKVISTAQEALENWLIECGVDKAATRNCSSRLPTYFTYAVRAEWHRNQAKYHPILQFFTSPFAKATEREWAWQQYSALLEKRIGESVFNESFSLEQIYIPLNAYYLTECPQRAGDAKASHEAQKHSAVVVELEQALTDWITNSDSADAVRVISGGPGSGKSSFCKIFAARLAKSGTTRTLFIPLHLIDPSKDLVDEVGAFARDERILSFNPLSPDSFDKELVIIFDGLDELASQGKQAAESARAFVREVERVANRINSTRLWLRVIISGREVVVQETETEFRKPKQILNVLPYFTTTRAKVVDRWAIDVDEFIDPHNLLKHDLRAQWWKRYGTLTGRSYEGLPKPLNRRDLDEVTAQPLLNYLVALSYTRNKIDFTENVNLNSVYEDLVEAVHERGYEKRGAYGPIRHMSSQQFVRVLEEVGLAAWHGDGRSTTIREIEEHCKASGLGSLLALFKEGAEAGVTRLLAAFFFRQQGQRISGDPTFVFTHKSFGEYLVANRITRAIERISKELKRRQDDPDEGWDNRDALGHWAQIAGPSEMTSYLHAFLVNQIRLRQEDTVVEWQQNLAQLFSHVLRHGMPMERTKLATFREALFQSRNAEECLLAALNACSIRTGRVADIEHTDPTAFGAWFKRIQGQRTGPESCLAARCLSYLNLSYCTLDIGDYYGADFQYSNLQHIAAHYSCFSHANLLRANLTGAVLSGSNLAHSIFGEATLTSAQLTECDLNGASFRGAKVEDMNVEVKWRTPQTFDSNQVVQIKWEPEYPHTARRTRAAQNETGTRVQ